MTNLQTYIIIVAIIAEAVALFISFTQRLNQKRILEELQKEKETLEEEKATISSEKDVSETKNAEKSFKFFAINQMSKTLAKEKNIKILKKLILDMLLETNSVSNGFSLENKNGNLEVFELKGVTRNDIGINITKKDNAKIWDILKSNRVMTFDEIKRYEEFSQVTKTFKEGFLITFVVSSYEETENEDINFVVFLGEKAYGAYAVDEDEFLDTLCGQIEIVLENSLKTDYIKSKNDELTEKVYNLTILNYASKMISASLDINEILDKSIDMMAEASRSEKAVIIYFDKEFEQIEVKGVRGDVTKDIIGIKSDVTKEEVEMLNEFKNIVIFTEASQNELNKLNQFYKNHKEIFSYFKHELFIPLLDNDDFLGMILLGMKFEDGYKSDNVDVYSTLASQISISLYNAKLYNLAITDGMTKLYLHRYFKTRLVEEMERGKRYDRKISLLMTDIDHFKKFNDTYGHQTGDEVLKVVANIIKESVRKSDVAARYGGEEFAVILPETGEEGANLVAENIRRKIEGKELNYGGERIKVTISIGVYTFDVNDKLTRDDDVEAGVKKADKALYYSKEKGRNRVTHFNQIKGY